MRGMSIGELAGASGVRTDTVRYYERIGLLAMAARTEAGYRSYGSEDLARLRFVRRAKSLGFSLEDIRRLIDLQGNDASTAGDVLALTRQRIEVLQNQIADLAAIEAALANLARDCPPAAPASDCPILAHLAGLHRSKMGVPRSPIMSRKD